MEKELKEKLQKVVELVKKDMANPDIDIEFCIPEVEMDSSSCNVNKEPYISVKYTIEEGDVHERKIKIRRKYTQMEPEDLANLITFYIEQFIEEIDSVEYGGE
ncbi:hypothetical protein [Hydrogenothermus marinus]|uniref:Uncharacterized protein n=1 Tax=Hydrogenothermus marinus TaxID=133270 RepID=A0A3M0BMD9_9AQUI|nr:hypothetical protein [Hydrogenothermus marinus]RMA97644.1 hypothetical protein CLV39_0264 [Hydrogenothermus marinus]